MINSDSFLLTSGIILTLLISATIIGYTGKFIFGSEKLKKSTNQIYEPDLNISSLCIFSTNAFTTSYETSPCFNKTLLLWYNPWLRQSIWTKFWNEIKAKKQLERLKQLQTEADNKTETVNSNDTIKPTDLPREKENAELKQIKEKPIEFVYSILVGLLVISGLLACWEVCKDKLRKNEAALAKARERECTLADFTINRHLRKESQQQTASHLPRQGSLELTAKVTQNLIHQSSLDRAFPKTVSEAVTSPELRRNSVPLFLSNDILPVVPTSPKLKLTKRQSLDISGEEMSLDLRKKPRHSFGGIKTVTILLNVISKCDYFSSF